MHLYLSTQAGKEKWTDREIGKIHVLFIGDLES